ncbi:MAG: glycosyltransferase family 2 protein [Nitrospinota bacterium]
MGETSPILVSFFVPCLNEESNIGRTIDTIVGLMQSQGYPYEIVVVDDASVDGSTAEVLGRSERYPQTQIELIQNPFCRGLGRNYFIAAQRGRGKYFMLVNGDAAEPAESIQTILSHMGEADAVVPYFGRNETRTLPRRALSRAFTFLVNVLSGHRLKYYNGPVLHTTENVRMWFSETAGFGYQAELLCRLLGEGISVVEVQIANSDRERGASKAFSITNLLSVANSLFHIFLRRLERGAFSLSKSSRRRTPRTPLRS